MPVNFRTPFGRFVLPLCLILVAVVSCAFYSHATQTARPEAEETVTTTSIIDQSSEYEDWLQEKAERVLQAFGESSPSVVISVEMRMDKSETETFTPDPQRKVVESVQVTEEIFKKRREGLMNESITENFEPGYMNVKKAENYQVGQVKTKTVRLHPKLKKVSCVVFVSEKNKERRQEIETAVAVALGLEFDRGDAVLASLK